ncbi:Golgi to ER traffic protein 2 [Debaryomyces fabryi]|uniref:Golgi to ER traffic protein 2 n=1 Tax=Debaryomyces fabryi TaxID=58627 RepID=A0A0V1Q0E3_9ASCO|nr:Golgi to ER traffic protein 2 [Debaryomyces fabryi]KSA01936.1 Golgi to ER traffic protein 2 [Debaryomyces fabryi]CUM48501.1 unnamed protein product [Debaryomyces fabryi]
MSEQSLSQDEKRRLLRERRQAKMARGKASERLNNILSQGSSVKDTTDAVSVLDSKTNSTGPSSKTAEVSPVVNSIRNPEDDPEIMDIENVTPETRVDEADIDKMLSNIFGANVGGNATDSNQDDFLANMMNMMKQGEGADGNTATAEPQEPGYQSQLNAYNIYQQKLWKFRFLIVRFTAVLANFFYHYLTIQDYSFSSSAHFYIRGLAPQSAVNSFITWFLTCEVAILASFYLITSRNNIYANASDGNLLLKGISMGAMVLPQLRAYQPLVVRLAHYWEVFSMLLGDIFLVVVLFGLISIYK